MTYTEHTGCTACSCPLENAARSAADAPWRSCDCQCHETTRRMLNLTGPLKGMK